MIILDLIPDSNGWEMDTMPLFLTGVLTARRDLLVGNKTDLQPFDSRLGP